MNKQRLIEAEAEAVRFLEAIKRLYSLSPQDYKDALDYGGKYTAAVKRSSMDLSRALAELRRS